MGLADSSKEILVGWMECKTKDGAPCVLVWATVKKYYRPDDLYITENYFSQFWRLEFWNLGTQMVRFWWGSSRLQTADFRLSSHEWKFFCKGANHIHEGFTLMILPPFKDPTSSYYHIRGSRISIYKFWGYTNFQSITLGDSSISKSETTEEKENRQRTSKDKIRTRIMWYLEAKRKLLLTN